MIRQGSVDVGIPFLGNITIMLVMLCAAYTGATALYSTHGGVRWLRASRFGALATCALVAVAVCLLAYAFQTHDFRIRYVARYSDRSMPWWYLVTSLWGGQDGSLLWWTFLLSGYTAVCVWWVKDRYLELQPWVWVTLMAIFIFFCILMLFAANPFATTYGAVPADGEGLNPLLQNYWMTIHPPSLYMGFVGWSVPFAFVVAALVTGRLREEWIYAIRRWVLVAWLFLSVGNLLGALWSYEELGWGGYWAWDPVENAAFLPWLSATAYLHSVMIQERRGMLRVWNVFLLCQTFILTIFGTFLTRSGLIASVHSFARSDIGIYFVYFLIGLVTVTFALIIWRLPKLRSPHAIDSLLSREFTFLLNNWILIGMQVFVLLATTFPLLSEWLRDETVTVGPSYYNKWMVPQGLILLSLMGVGPLMSWRRATGRGLFRAFLLPTSLALLTLVLHLLLGDRLGFPPFVESEEIYDTRTGRVLATIFGTMPAASVALCVFVLATVVQEFWRGGQVRKKNTDESLLRAMVRMVAKARRRYGGYLVHVGIVCMFLGFTGAAYDREQEAALKPGETLKVGSYHARFDRARVELDANKRMLFAEMTLLDGSVPVSRISPAKFIYKTHPEMPTTEVAIHSTLLNDVYVIMNSINPETKTGTFKVIVRPLVAWIWIGGLMLILGVFIAVAPSIKELLGLRILQVAATPRTRASMAPLLLAGMVGAAAAALGGEVRAQSDSSSSLHAGSVSIKDPHEHKLFERLLCQCGSCARLPLSTCACGWAEDMRGELREELAAGSSIAAIQASYRKRFGAKALAVPADQGLDRALWAIPIAALALAAAGLFALGRRWKRRNKKDLEDSAEAHSERAHQDYEDALEQELRALEDR